MRDFIYLDHAAATPLDKQVLAAMEPYFAEDFYNPSALYLPAKKVAGDMANARSTVAACLGARPSEVIFTSGGTESNNLAIHGVMRRYPGANIVVSAVEHESLRLPAGEHDCRIAPVKSDGLVDLEKLESLIDDKTVLVSVIYANNEVGTIQPLRKIAGLLKEKRAGRKNDLPLLFHTDAAQAGNYLDLHISGLGVDMMSINGGKIYGPKGSGALYVRAGIELLPLVQGGGQERTLRSGTENVPAIIGLAAALMIAQKDFKSESRRLAELQRQFTDGLAKKIPQATVNGSLKHRLPNNVHITIPGADNERLIMELDEQGILCAAGSACSASKDEPSHVLKAMGLSDSDAQSSLRFSMGRATTAGQIEKTLNVLSEIVR